MAIFRTAWVSQVQNVSILDFIGAKDDGRGGDNCSYKACKAPVKSSPLTNQHPAFAGRMPFLWPDQHWMEKYHMLRICLPQAHLWVFQACPYIHTYIKSIYIAHIILTVRVSISMHCGRWTKKSSVVVWKLRMTVQAVVDLMEGYSRLVDRQTKNFYRQICC